MDTPADGLQTPSGLATPSGMASVVSTIAGGLETPDFLELRKNVGSSERERDRSLYKVLEEKNTHVRGIVGSERGYDVSAAIAQGGAGGAIPVLGEERGSKVCFFFTLFSSDSTERELQRKAGNVDLSISPADLEAMGPAELKALYEASTSRDNSAGVPGAGNREDFSEMVAKEMARKKVKMERDRDRGKDRGGDRDKEASRREREYRF